MNTNNKEAIPVSGFEPKQEDTCGAVPAPKIEYSSWEAEFDVEFAWLQNYVSKGGISDLRDFIDKWVKKGVVTVNIPQDNGEIK